MGCGVSLVFVTRKPGNPQLSELSVVSQQPEGVEALEMIVCVWGLLLQQLKPLYGEPEQEGSFSAWRCCRL